MSEHNQVQHSGRNRRSVAEDNAASDKEAAKLEKEIQAEDAANAEADAAKSVPTMTCELKSDKDTVICTFDVPRKWAAGMVNTEHSALIIDTSNLRQFTNNQTANAKARAKRFAEAKTDAERAANVPLTAADYQALWADYSGPAIGDMQRLGSAERMRLDAGWSAWVQMVTEHNAGIIANPPVVVMAKAGMAGVKVGYSIPSAKAKAETDEAFKERREAAQSARTAFIEKFLSLPQYAERVQVQMDRLQAERGKDKAAAGALVVDTAGETLL